VISKRNFYSNRIVNKPWGYEYVIYSNSDKLAITLVKINYGHKTSLHCHPQKKTGFIILSGRAQVQIGIYKENKKCFNSLSRLVFRPGLFHSLKSISKKGLYALEIETPYKKKDLVRFTDNYGRQREEYEGKRFTKILDSKFLKFKNPIQGKQNKYDFNNVEITIESKKNFKNLKKKDDKSTSAILKGSLVDKKGQNVISYGEIIKTSTLRILSDKFMIKKPLTILRVSKKK
jgi:mannose-6-phosphate isomerase-like protein (cupin superfamily)